MIAIILAAALSAETFECEINVLVDPQPIMVRAACPNEAGSAQETANAVLSRIDLPPEAADHGSASRIWSFTRDVENDAWRWPALPLYTPPPSPPTDALRRAISAKCLLGGYPDSSGRLVDAQAVCETSSSSTRIREAFERVILRSAQRARAVPGHDGQCVAIPFEYRFADRDVDAWPDVESVCGQSEDS